MATDEPPEASTWTVGMVLLLSVIGFVFGLVMLLFGEESGHRIGGGILSGLSLVAAGLLFR